ncbi:MAG: prolipoprotein diacylglyceryl transferase [Bacilli bacterium]|nr:prolipoprotein diacylglyceryl transferase [Bacilli bacterium]
MYPDLFGIPDFSYTLMIVIGVIACLICLVVFLKKRGYKKNTIIDILACTLFTIAIGVVGAIIFQNVYDLISDPANYHFSFKMTFYGGLIFGIVAFILLFNFYVKKHNNIRIREIAYIAPLCITSAHAFGRIGCLLAGCCYGAESHSWVAIDFPGLGERLPTQLFEAIFLFVLSGVLIYLIFKTKFKWTLHLYLASYSIFRFIIEFFRDDAARGGTLFGLYPSQVICIVVWIVFVPSLWALKKFVFYPIPEDEQK